MSKGLEEYKYSNLELLREIWFNVPEGSQKIHQKHFDLILSRLNELQAIKESNPSKALECWNWLNATIPQWCREKDKDNQDTLIPIKQYILKAQEQEKVLEILKEKRVDLSYLRCCFEDNQSVERYNEYIRNKTMDYDHEEELTQEEFDLVKRWYNV